MPEEFEFDLFLSHSSADSAIAAELATRLKSEGLRVWFDEWAIQPGDSIPAAIEEGLERSRTLVLLLSKAAFSSDWVTLERHTAFFRDPTNKQKRLIPVRLDDTEFKESLKVLSHIDWRNRAPSEFSKLLRACFPLLPANPSQDPSEARNLPLHRDRFKSQLARDGQALRECRRKLILDGGSSTEIDSVNQKLLEIKRQIRDGPQLIEGDCLSNRYLLLERLGSGGFGTVWRALDEYTGSVVAIKVLHGQYSDESERRSRFKRGAFAMQRLMHPHVVRILEADSEDAGYSFYVMEYLDGGTFENAILAGKLARDQIRGIVLQIGVALAKAHEINMVHRDVTPENILLSQDTTAKLTDFDLVRIADSTGGTKTGALGKFIYTPPECMYFAKAADPRCDIFSLGMTAIFAFYGERLPVTAFANSPAFLASLQLPQPLKQVLARAVDHEPERRHSTMIAFCDAFANAFEKQTTGSKTRILVVDDSATDRLLMAGLLERHGFATILARDGLEAIEQIRCEEPDAVVTDLQIPSMNGLEVISQLREQFPRIPVILTTALGSEEIVVQAFQMGAASYVGKRQIAAELAATVESVLGGSRARWEGDVPRSK